MLETELNVMCYDLSKYINACSPTLFPPTFQYFYTDIFSISVIFRNSVTGAVSIVLVVSLTIYAGQYRNMFAVVIDSDAMA